MLDGMVIAKKYLSETEARLDCSRLSSLGIESWVEADNCDGMYPQLDLQNPVKLLVRQEDAAQARDLINSRAASAVDHPWDCSGCGEHIEAGFDSCWQCGASFKS